MIYHVDSNLNVIMPPIDTNINGNGDDNNNDGGDDNIVAEYLPHHKCWQFKTRHWAYFGNAESRPEAAFLAAEQAERDGNALAAGRLLEYAISA